MLSLGDKIKIGFYIFLSVVAIICFIIYVGMITRDIFRSGFLPDVQDTTMRNSVAGVFITFGAFLGLGAVALIMQIVITLERDYLKRKKLKKHLKNVLFSFLSFIIAAILFLVIFLIFAKRANEKITRKQRSSGSETINQYSKFGSVTPAAVLE